jgi:hypothetical protein
MSGARERKRAERRKRKRRSAERSESGPPVAAASDASAPGDIPPTDAAPQQEETFQERMARRYEERNEEARAKLEPLDRGERPTAVTVGAVVSAIFALIFTASTVVAATGHVHVSGRDPSPVGIGLFAVGLWVMTWGRWKARYWAVLGFQVLLLMVLVLSALGLVAVTTIPQLIASLVLLGGAGTLFYFMVRAMARIQMPRRPGTE